jgi:hypothetical protein
MALGGSITVRNPAGDTLVVSITSTTGQTWFTNDALSSAASFPATITDTTTYYTGINGVSTVSVLRNGVQIANTPDGTRSVELREGQNLTFEPSPDATKRLAPAEIAARYVGKAADLKAVVATGTASVNFDEIAAGETGSKTFTLTGVAAGDIVVVNPPVLTTGLAFAGAAVTGANTVTVYAVNSSAAAIDQAAATFSYLWFDLT